MQEHEKIVRELVGHVQAHKWDEAAKTAERLPDIECEDMESYADTPLGRTEREIFAELSGLAKAHNWDEALKAAELLRKLGIV